MNGVRTLRCSHYYYYLYLILSRIDISSLSCFEYIQIYLACVAMTTELERSHHFIFHNIYCYYVIITTMLTTIPVNWLHYYRPSHQSFCLFCRTKWFSNREKMNIVLFTELNQLASDHMLGFQRTNDFPMGTYAYEHGVYVSNSYRSTIRNNINNYYIINWE